MGLKANDFNFGDIAGNTSIVMRATQYRKGGRISFAFSNKTYRGRVMASYSSGLSLKGWAYSFLVARRYGEEGYLEGTLYDSNSFFGSVEKKISNTHQLNFTAFYSPNRRALATALTQEVRDLKGIRYNPNWGYQDSEKRSSRVREIKEPMILLNHYWNFSEKTSLNTNLGVQRGKIGVTRLDYGSNRNPAGNYYQRLPSYFLREKNPTTYDYQQAYLAEQLFINNGQIEWNSLYAGNAISDNTAYSIQEDRVDDTQFTVNTIFNTRLSKRIFLNANINYRNLKSENFAELKDLLGGNGYLDIDSFGPGGVESNSDIQNLNRVVQKGERYKYNYDLTASVISGFAQARIMTNRIDFYIGLSAANSNYKRVGLYQNGYFPEIGRSLGEGEPLNFMNFGCKAGATYKFTGRHLMDLNVGYFTKAPTLQSSFANVRQNNDIVFGIKNEGIISADVGYIFRTPILKSRFTGYYSSIKNQTDVGVFFTENALGNEETSAFVNEIVTDIEKVSIGVEIGVEAQVLPTFKLKAAISEGHNMYTRNPNLYLAGDDFGMEGNDISTQGIRSVILKDYHVASGPERAIQLGFEYSGYLYPRNSFSNIKRLSRCVRSRKSNSTWF